MFTAARQLPVGAAACENKMTLRPQRPALSEHCPRVRLQRVPPTFTSNVCLQRRPRPSMPSSPIAPEPSAAELGSVAALFQQQRFAEAEAGVQQLIGRYPQHDPLLDMLGSEQAAQQMHREAAAGVKYVVTGWIHFPPAADGTTTGAR